MAKMNWDRSRQQLKGYTQDSYLMKKDTTDADWIKKHRKKAAAKKKKEGVTQMLNGGPVLYVWRKGSLKKAHIALFKGTLCKLENQGHHVMKRLTQTGNALPDGIELCQLCKDRCCENGVNIS